MFSLPAAVLQRVCTPATDGPLFFYDGLTISVKMCVSLRPKRDLLVGDKVLWPELHCSVLTIHNNLFLQLHVLTILKAPLKKYVSSCT